MQDGERMRQPTVRTYAGHDKSPDVPQEGKFYHLQGRYSKTGYDRPFTIMMSWGEKVGIK